MGIEFNPENVNLNYDGKSSGKKVTPQNQNQVGSTEIGDLLRKNKNDLSKEYFVAGDAKLPVLPEPELPDEYKGLRAILGKEEVPPSDLKGAMPVMPNLSEYIKDKIFPNMSEEQIREFIENANKPTVAINDPGYYGFGSDTIELPNGDKIITEADGKQYIVDENGNKIELRSDPGFPIPKHEAPPAPGTPIYPVYDNDDFIPLDSPLGQGLSRPTREFNPNIDGKYKPVYGGMNGGRREIIGFEPYQQGDFAKNMISLDSELGQKIAEHFKALDDRKTNGSPAIIGEKQEYDNYEPIYENVVNTTGSQPKIIGYREKTDAEKQGSVDY